MVKNIKGFTLVEVIVVATIVALLAAVAIPLYMGYLRDSRIDVGNNVGGSLASAGGATVQQQLAIPVGTHVSPAPPADPIHVTFPNVSNDPEYPNQVLIPNSYTAVITAKTARCYFTPYGENSSQIYVFAE
jgi:prepilin-type N-terminal cleavage/methylation domain-containing protein